MCGILKCLYSCRWLLIFSTVVSVSEWVMLVYMFCSNLNISFPKVEWESLKFVLFVFFHLFHYFSLVVGVEKSLLSLANENLWNHLEFSCMGMNEPSFNCWSRGWTGDGRAQSLQNWKVYSYNGVFTLDVWESRNAKQTASTHSQEEVVVTAREDVSTCFKRSVPVCHGFAMDKLSPGT